MPNMHSGDIMCHETMGEVVEVGKDNKKLKVGDRVIVPITISCGECFFCKRGFFSGCERSNPDPSKAKKAVEKFASRSVRLYASACQIGNQMRVRGAGRILITGSIAGFVPGSDQAVYNGSKAFFNSFSFALRNELQDTGVTVTCLMPGPTDTRFFERADMLETDVGQAEKDDPADVAKVGFDAMMGGEGDVVAGWKNKFQAAMANVTPASVLAAQHARMAAPETAKD